MVQKEKQVKSYTRKSKSGKQVQVKSYSAKYNSAEDMVKEALKQKKGAGKELEALKKKPKEGKVPNLIDDVNSPWNEFENNFEEGWGGNSSVFCLANHEHHREVANLAAYNLSKKYDGNKFYQRKDWETLAQKAYNDAAKKLYPKEKLWSGDNEDNPAFWHEHLTAGGSKKSAIKQLWRKEWGSFDSFGKKSTVKTEKKSPKETSAKKGSKVAVAKSFSMDDFAHWYEGDGSKQDKAVEKSLRKILGKKNYEALNDYVADNYKKGGHKLAFKKVSSFKDEATTKKASTKVGKPSKSSMTPQDAPASQRRSYEKHEAATTVKKPKTLNQIMSDLASSGKYTSDSKMRKAAERIFKQQELRGTEK